MALTLATIWVRFASRMTTMLRETVKSSSLNQYVPGCRTVPATRTGSLQVNLVSLSAWSALAEGSRIPIIATDRNTKTQSRMIFIFSASNTSTHSSLTEPQYDVTE